MTWLGRSARTVFLWDFVTSFFLAMRYFFAPKKTLNYPFERSHRFAGIRPNSGHRDYSRLSCGIEETQLGPRAAGSPQDGLGMASRIH